MVRAWRIWAVAASLWLAAASAFAVLTFDNSFYSPRNKERTVRKSTTLIVLHTTEAPSSSALHKLSDLGECNFCIDEAGKVYRIIDHRREAYHAGRSMWNGRANVDEFSVGIEVCGYHDKMPNVSQIRSLSALVGELKSYYKVPDQNVVSHSHVAYGAPNKWQTRNHRGRKRCGMLFALPSLRAQLNLKARPTVDTDVKAGRLVVADTYLARVLYGSIAANQIAASAPKVDANVIGKARGAWDIARDAYDDPTTLYVFPDGTRKRGNQIGNFKLVPSGTKVLVNAPADNRSETFQIIGVNGHAQDIAGDETLSVSTIYVYPDGRYVRGSQLTPTAAVRLPYGTRVLLGYSVGGPVSSNRPATSICGNRWRSTETYFLISNVLIPGNRVNAAKIPSGTIVFYKS